MVEQAIIPGLPDDLALRCLAKVSHGHHGLLETVCKGWRDLMRSSEYADYKASEGWCGDWLFVLTEGAPNEWIAYDPDADRWHPLPMMPKAHPGWRHKGFSCVCVCSKFLVIGGSYKLKDPFLPKQRPVITNDVLQFDPFKKQWVKVASMRTPRSYFACSVISGKVYVAGGCNSSSVEGLDLAEVYDPVADKWEDLPSMPTPRMYCSGLSDQGKFHVVKDDPGWSQRTCEVFDPSNGAWHTTNIWYFRRVLNFAMLSGDNDQLYVVINFLGGNAIETRNSEGQWNRVCRHPDEFLLDVPRPLQSFSYSFASLKHELYLIGGRARRENETGVYSMVKLNFARAFDPKVRPLNWRITRRMWGQAAGHVFGCAAMEEKV